jgi:hypothetical protein
MKRAILSAIVCLAYYSCGMACVIAQDISGPWQNVEFLGLASVDNKCTYIALRDHRYLFSPEREGQRLVSFTTAEFRAWITVTDLNCVFPGEDSNQQTYLRLLKWDGLARLKSSSRWEIGTGPGSCAMQGCAEKDLRLDAISAEAEGRESLLIETRAGMPLGLPPLPFRRLAVAERLAEDAATVLPELMKGLDEGNCFNWYQTAWSTRAIETSKISALCALETQFQQSTGDVMETRVIGSWTLGLDPRRAGQAENVVLIQAAAVLGSGTNLGRAIVLIQEGGSWRILSRIGR